MTAPIKVDVLEIEVPVCSRVYGVPASGCQASIGVTGDQPCFQTRCITNDCQDTANFDPVTRIDRFISTGLASAVLPISLAGARACIYSVREKGGEEILPGNALTYKGRLTVVMSDFRDHDRGQDPYRDQRSYNPADQGTFWGKWLARNPRSEGYIVRRISGSIDTDAMTFTPEITKTYVMDVIQGPDHRGKVQLEARSIMAKAAKGKGVFPPAKSGNLASAISAVDTSLTLSPAGIGDLEYDANGYLTLASSEVVSFTRVGDSCNIGRGLFGTTARAHDAGDAVAQAKYYNAEEIRQVYFDAYSVSMPTAWLPLNGQWLDETNENLIGYEVTRLIPEPEEIDDIARELREQTPAFTYAVAETPAVYLDSVRTAISGSFTDIPSARIIEGNLDPRRDDQQRASQVHVYYDQIDPTQEKDQKNNYRKRIIATTPENLYEDENIHIIYARFIVSDSQANVLAERILARRGETTLLAMFQVDGQQYGDLRLADLIRFHNWTIQDATGAQPFLNAEVVSIIDADPKTPRRRLKIKAEVLQAIGVAGKWEPDDYPKWDDATEQERADGSFWTTEAGQNPDGSQGKVWV